MYRIYAIVTAALLGAGHAMASGMLIPKDQSIPPLAIKHQRVDISIKDAVATARIEQVFKNSVNRDLEAVYIFPLPENAAIADFAMYINGKRMEGELVEKGKARKIYQDIVRRMKDPGLLEHIGGNLFRVSVYPVPKNGEQKIEISYSQTLSYESGMYHYVYPLKTSEKASQTLEDFTVRVDLNTTVPLKTIYSPSHKSGISRKGEHHAVIGFEEDRSLLDRDFELFYGISQKDFGLNLLTHSDDEADGFFMMLISPRLAPKKDEVVERDITFVFDTSGSMSGDKITQARDSLTYCIGRLNQADRFNVIRFSTDVEAVSEGMLEVNDDNTAKALAFVDDLEARGGTAIHDALVHALGIERDSARPHNIVFLTDGRPTIGETDIDVILKDVDKKIAERTRVFVFGVGDDVNTHLLDRLSGGHGGTSQYVKPHEDIEVKVSSFYDKISHPVLGSPRITIDKLKAHSLHPQELPDLFAGEQITLFGRYKAAGDSAVRLTGEINGEKREFVYEGTFPVKSTDNDFIPRLWATRRVGFLLDQIRLHGEANELKDEVMLLSKEFGIMTPYTSYLVLENEDAYATHGIDRRSDDRLRNGLKVGDADGWAGREMEEERASKRGEAHEQLGASSGARAPASRATMPMPVFDLSVGGGVQANSEESQEASKTASPARGPVDSYLRQQSGKKAVDLSRAIAKYKQAEFSKDQIANSVRRVGKRIFYLIDHVWIDQDYREGMKETRLVYAADEYFVFLEKHPDLKSVFALGERVIVVTGENTALVIE
ncbi:MAG: VIT domain-containing protein [Verrucomicrobia bacterium]|nr:VIT domain-containing protein [Verrucomicrobiota bacterium]MDA1085666.1 VIT domain-containing protein [Verrucomicrobiota bacterium]